MPRSDAKNRIARRFLVGALTLGLAFGILVYPSEVKAYSRSPSGDGQEPFTFVVAQSDFSGGSCQNGYYASLQIRFDGQSVGYGSMTDWIQSDGSSDIWFNDIDVSTGFGLEYAPHPSIGDLPIDVLSVYLTCNATNAYDYGWSSANMSDAFEWQAGTTASTGATTADDITLLVLLVILYAGIGIIAYQFSRIK